MLILLIVLSCDCRVRLHRTVCILRLNDMFDLHDHRGEAIDDVVPKVMLDNCISQDL